MPYQRIKFYQTGSFAVGNRLLTEDQRSVQSTAGRSNALTCGHRACQGCGEALGARYALDAVYRATGGKMIAVNATGCLEVFSTPFPETSWQIAWLHSLFGNAPAVASGVAAALKAQGRTDIRVVGQGGDGGTVDIGFACLSGMFERNDDVLYICYDNQAYMNTGVQRSGATPPAARTATTQAVGREPGNRFGQGKNVPLIAMAHEIPYVATATVADLRDLEYKAARAMDFRGARYLHILVPCPLGWGSSPADTVKVARLATESGLFPVFEAEAGEVTSSTPIRHQVPVTDYLRIQARYAHLFKPRNGPTSSTASRRPPIATSAGSASSRRPLEDSDHGQAIRDHPGRRVEPGQPHRRWRTERPLYVHNLPPCNSACPAGGEHPAVAVRRGRRSREVRGRLAADHAGQPVPGRDGPDLLPAVRDRLQPGPAGLGRGHQLGGAVPRRRGAPQGLAGFPSLRLPRPGSRRVKGAGEVGGGCWW